MTSTAATSGGLLGMADAARYLNVHPITVRRLIRRGALSAVRVGRQVRIKPHQLDEFLKVSQLRGAA